MSSMDMATTGHPLDAAIQNPHGFWSAVRDVVRCNRKDGKRWQCSREVVPGQKYCERHVGRGRNRPKRSAEDCSATSEVPCGPSLGAISSVSMAAAAHGGFPVPSFNGMQPPALPPVANEVKQLQAMRVPCFDGFPSGFEKVVRVKMLYDRVRSNFPCFDPSLVSVNPVFMDNAGGSQCAQVVIDALANYMKTSYVQPGAGYELSRRAAETVKAAHDHMKTFANAHGVGEVVIGPSASQLLVNLSDSYSDSLREGDEIIIHDANHEANVAPWLRVAARRGASVVWWRINYDTFESNLEDLENLLTPRTRIVAVPHVSNLLGEILDLEKVVKVVKSRIYEGQVRVIADGAAYTPHRAVDVVKWGVDWYVFSSYKAFGPHIAVLFGVEDAFAEVQDEASCWEFAPRDVVMRKFELGDMSHEACAGLVALTQYLAVLSRIGESFSASSDGGSKKALQQQQQQHSTMGDAGGHVENGGFSLFDTNPRPDVMANSSPLPDNGTKCLNPVGPLDLQRLPQTFMEPVTPSSLRDWEFALRGTSFGREAIGYGGMVSSRLDRVVVEAAYDTITLLEQPLQEKLLAYLRSRNDIVIVGPKSAAAELRIPTVSFVHETKRSSDIAEALQSAGFAIRHGHMYSFCLLSGLESHKRLTVNSMMHDGVVRISLVHYNTPIEVASLIACLQATL